MPLKVVELFAGVGGFRIGLEGPPGETLSEHFSVVYANQYEPKYKTQHAADTYIQKWNLVQSAEDSCVYINPLNSEEYLEVRDIEEVDKNKIPDHDVLVAGYPCQDYSVAQGNRGKGIKGKKGVLWWQLAEVIGKKKPRYLILENVDRLITSPVKQRGRDMAIMLSHLDGLGYAVEWRIITASDYGFSQKRKRVFLIGFRKGTPEYKQLASKNFDAKSWIEGNGIIGTAFPINSISDISPITLNRWKNDLSKLSQKFNTERGKDSPSPFMNAGVMVKNSYWTVKTTPTYQGKKNNLLSVLIPPSKIPNEYIIDIADITKEKGWLYAKGAKKAKRVDPEGFEYTYDEGAMYFPDRLTNPSRTIVTGEGTASPSRNKHVVKFNLTKKQRTDIDLDSQQHQDVRIRLQLKPTEWLRRLTPIELERLNGFPDNHTEGHIPSKRAFLMGNALVVGIVKKLGFSLINRRK